MTKGFDDILKYTLYTPTFLSFCSCIIFIKSVDPTQVKMGIHDDVDVSLGFMVPGRPFRIWCVVLLWLMLWTRVHGHIRGRVTLRWWTWASVLGLLGLGRRRWTGSSLAWLSVLGLSLIGLYVCWGGILRLWWWCLLRAVGSLSLGNLMIRILGIFIWWGSIPNVVV